MELLAFIKTADGGAIVEAMWRGMTPIQIANALGLDPLFTAQKVAELEKAGF